ncbi:hypothetical protein ACRAWB_09450 [Leifsonia poae]|uniref:hypothetical protein n=1 Tax=Leifsonia poae TaxID=110933 RepID=UPI003D69639C
MMHDVVGIVLAAVILVPALVLIVRRDVSRSLEFAVVASLACAVLIPSFATSAVVAVIAVLGPAALLAIAIIRDRAHLRTLQYPWVLAAFLAWSGIAGSFGSPVKLVLLNVATVVLLMLFAVAVVGAGSRSRNVFLPLFPIVIVVELAIGIWEEVLRAPAPWPRANGTDVISHRVNEVLPLLPGRAMGTTAQPIPYGVLVGFAVVVCLWFAVRTKSAALYTAAGLGLVTMVFAGTRSAFVTLAGVLVLWALMRIRWRKSALIWVVAAVVGVAAVMAILVVFMNSAVLATASFQHRAGILSTAGNLLGREPLQVVFGTGYASIPDLLAHGIVSGVKGITVFDEEFVRTAAAMGLVGLGLLVAVIVRGIVKGTELTRLLILFVAGTFLFFDGFSWRLIAMLFVLAIAYGYGKPGPSAWDVPRYLHRPLRRPVTEARR